MTVWMKRAAASALPALALAIAGFAAAGLAATAPASFNIERFSPTIWGKGKFAEMIVASGPHKTLYLAGMTPYDENQTANVLMNPGDVYGQCAHEFTRIKALLALQGATLANVVRSTVYLTNRDADARAGLRKCRAEAYGSIQQPADTMVFVSGLAGDGQLIEIDIQAVVPE